MSLILENLIDEETIFYAGSITDYTEMELIIAGAKIKYPRSFLSIFNIIPRNMTKYEMDLVQTENITGAVFTTAFNIKKNLGIVDEKLTIESIENYYLDPNNDVLTLMINNTSLDNVTTRKKRSKRNKNPVLFRQGSIPLFFIFESRKKVEIYKENVDKASSDNSYMKIDDNIAVASKYANMSLLDVHSPSASMKLNGVYGFTYKNELRKLSSDKEIDEYSNKPLQEPVRLNDFIGLFDCVKKNIPLTNIPIME
ncbi:putative DNA-binding virion core protein [Lumpy skin disease virus]|uniref:Core protein VP8 n=1 Tax=Lumpy skin disease virus TaxID=59509 RepID=Q77GD3_LSDV|nr:DNA-binding virion core protein [Lumpy skin disease virus NI-2490]AAN02631.1 putative DNA-binding virion core protein [Lumpy skin disease virus NW-LW]AAN02788.1 putative DNA-binding virion core protein [Lumpy skin disease virus]AAK85024.1 LSDV063 putative DNA-binding virion core protein [Lumpy skin disease virus NI-2490]AOE47639.1 DNA-binding virion core protein [Lumpy skin disease virus]AOO78623.1 putative DNA-binding virion core protein [Lumpy skin disease virus]